jgi:formylglycine-generating enzyme required for sulfatase activity
MEGELCPEDCDTERPVCAGEAGALCWVRIPAGRYLMGSPESEVGRDDDETQHEVVITRPFWMTSTEVTADQWEALGGERSGGCRDGCPIPGVFWWEALGWLNVLSRSEGLEECYILAECEPPTDHPYYCASVQTIGGPGAVGCAGYRLPTEAEWEYAARATSTGPSYGPLDEIAWYDMSTGGVSHPVGLLAPNRWHLFDIMGNLGEWVWDHYAPYDLRVVADPVGPDDARGMIQRGCPFHYWEARCRVAYRIATPGGDSATEGFRPVRTIVGGR